MRKPWPTPAVPQALFNVMNDGSVAIGGIPANFGFFNGTSVREFYLNGKATITGQLRAGEGSPGMPTLSFIADTGTGFYRPAADSLGLVTSGVERARVTTAGLQIGASSLAFGLSTSGRDTILERDDANGNTLAQRNTTNAQTFRLYENYTSSSNFARLSFQAVAGGNYLIRSEAGGSGTLRSLQIGTGPRSAGNAMGLDTFIHAGQGSGTAAGGAIRFQYAPAAGASPNPLVTAWQIGPTGHLTAGDSPTGDSARMIKWGTTYSTPAIKATSGSNPELQIRRGDDSGGAALLYRLSVAPWTTTHPVSESESNRTFTNEGAIGAVTFTLPNSYSNVGFHCHFANVAGYPVFITASGSDTIRIGTQVTPAQPGSINASTVGNTIHLVCTQVYKWVALSREGTWNGVA